MFDRRIVFSDSVGIGYIINGEEINKWANSIELRTDYGPGIQRPRDGRIARDNVASIYSRYSNATKPYYIVSRFLLHHYSRNFL